MAEIFSDFCASTSRNTFLLTWTLPCVQWRFPLEFPGKSLFTRVEPVFRKRAILCFLRHMHTTWAKLYLEPTCKLTIYKINWQHTTDWLQMQITQSECSGTRVCGPYVGYYYMMCLCNSQALNVKTLLWWIMLELEIDKRYHWPSRISVLFQRW